MTNYRNITINLLTLDVTFGANNCSDTHHAPFLTFDFQEVSELNAYKALVFSLPNLNVKDHYQQFKACMRELCRDYHEEEKHEVRQALKTTPEDFTRIKNDINGNPRYVCHFLQFKNPDHKERFTYEQALKLAKQLGGRKFHNKQYGGGIVFQSYALDSLCHEINKLNGSENV